MPRKPNPAAIQVTKVNGKPANRAVTFVKHEPWKHYSDDQAKACLEAYVALGGAKQAAEATGIDQRRIQIWVRDPAWSTHLEELRRRYSKLITLDTVALSNTAIADLRKRLEHGEQRVLPTGEVVLVEPSLRDVAYLFDRISLHHRNWLEAASGGIGPSDVTPEQLEALGEEISRIKAERAKRLTTTTTTAHSGKAEITEASVPESTFLDTDKPDLADLQDTTSHKRKP